MTGFYLKTMKVRGLLAQLFARIIRFFGALVFGETVAPSSGTTKVSAKWLTHVLQNQSVLDKSTTVTNVDIEGLDGNRGMVGAMTRLRLTYNKETDAPDTMILKMSKDGADNRRNVIAAGQFREAQFYENKLNSAASSVLPKVFYSYGSALLGEYVILMEDLKKPGIIGANLLLGNQIWGTPPLEFQVDPVQLLDLMFVSAADIHAQFWNDRSLLSKPWLKASSWYNGENQVQWEISIATARKGWEATKKKEGVKLDATLSSIIEESFARSSWAHLQTHLKNPSIPFTLCHGDFHAANMSLQRLDASADPSSMSTGEFREKHRLVMYDWSEVGPWEPTTDLAQTLISDVKPHIFKEHAEALVRSYWERLVEKGVSAEQYPFETCWESFCRGGAERWIWVFSVMGIFPVPPVAMQYFHDQLLAFITAFGSGKTFYHLKPVVCVA